MPYKAIKGNKLKIKEVRFELLNATRKVAGAVKKDFDSTTKTWDNPVDFEILVTLKDGPGFEVMTDNKIYGYVDKGTREHMIFPKGDYPLRFQSGYSPKTTPGVIGSQQGGSFGDTVFSRGVLHPGTEPRNFSVDIYKKFLPRYKREMEQALVRGLEKAQAKGTI